MVVIVPFLALVVAMDQMSPDRIFLFVAVAPVLFSHSFQALPEADVDLDAGGQGGFLTPYSPAPKIGITSVWMG